MEGGGREGGRGERRERGKEGGESEFESVQFHMG